MPSGGGISLCREYKIRQVSTQRSLKYKIQQGNKQKEGSEEEEAEQEQEAGARVKGEDYAMKCFRASLDQFSSQCQQLLGKGMSWQDLKEEREGFLWGCGVGNSRL